MGCSGSSNKKDWQRNKDLMRRMSTLNDLQSMIANDRFSKLNFDYIKAPYN